MAIKTPNMGLILPVIGTDSGLVWEQDVNANSSTLDQHNHSPGNGAPISSSGISVTSDFPFNGNNLTLVGSVGFSPQVSPLTGTTLLYVSGADLYYNDLSGAQIQITAGHSLNAVSSGISSGSAAASFVSSILTVVQSPGVAAAIDAATYILRYNGSYPSPSGNFIALEAPSSLSGGYAFTFPANTPASNLPLFMGTTGAVTTGQIITSQIAPLNITAPLISDQNIITRTIADGNITTVKIADANVTAAKIETNTNLNGSLVQAGSHAVVVSNTNASASLAIIRGQVNSSGGAVAGEGFTTNLFATGQYLITFNTGFADDPSVVAMCSTDLQVAHLSTLATTSVVIHVSTASTGALANAGFSFIIIGKRA